MKTAWKRFFSPEFLNRIDDVVIFNSLTKEDILQIADIQLKKLFARIEQIGYKFKISDSAKEFIADKGFDVDFGARPLNRAIQKYLEDPIAEEMLKSELVEGDTIDISYTEGDALQISIQKKKEPRKKKDAPAAE